MIYPFRPVYPANTTRRRGAQAGDDRGWASPVVLGAMLSGTVLLALAARIESRSAQPLIEPDLFRRAGYLPVLGVAIAGNFGFSALIFFTALYLQDQLDLAPLPAGLVMIAFSACFVVTLPLAGGLLQRASPLPAPRSRPSRVGDCWRPC